MPTAASGPKVELKGVVKLFKQSYKQAIADYYQPRSSMMTHLVCMRSAGWEMDYASLMALSGLAGAFAYEPKDFFWVSYMPLPGDTRRIAAASGFGWQWEQCHTAEQAWELLSVSLDAGRPLRAPYLEELVIAGYQAADEPAKRKVLVLCEPFARTGKWWSWKQFEEALKTGNEGYIGRHIGKVQTLPPVEVAIEVMQDALACADSDPRGASLAFSKVKFGLSGMQAFAADVADMDKDKGYFHPGWMGCHNLTPQVSARRCMAEYLMSVVPQFSLAQAKPIAAAAKKYQAAYDAWQAFDRQLGHTCSAPQTAWTSARRRRAGAEAIRLAVRQEKAALAKLREVLRLK